MIFSCDLCFLPLFSHSAVQSQAQVHTVLIGVGNLHGEEKLCQMTPQSSRSVRLNAPMQSQLDMSAEPERDASSLLVSREKPHSSDIKLKLIRPAGRYLLQSKRQTGSLFLVPVCLFCVDFMSIFKEAQKSWWATKGNHTVTEHREAVRSRTKVLNE